MICEGMGVLPYSLGWKQVLLILFSLTGPPWARCKISGRCRYRNNSSSIHIQTNIHTQHKHTTYKVTSMLTNIYAPIDSLSFVNRRDSYLCIPGKFPFSISKCFSYPSRETSPPLGLSLLTIEVFGDGQRKWPLTLGLEDILFSICTNQNSWSSFVTDSWAHCMLTCSEFSPRASYVFQWTEQLLSSLPACGLICSHTRIDNYPDKSRCLSSVIPAHLGQLGMFLKFVSVWGLHHRTISVVCLNFEGKY